MQVCTVRIAYAGGMQNASGYLHCFLDDRKDCAWNGQLDLKCDGVTLTIPAVMEIFMESEVKQP